MSIKLITKDTFFVVSLSLFLLSCGKENDDTAAVERLRPVKTITVGSDLAGDWREFPAVVDVAKKAELGFSVSGKLKKLSVKEGQTVKVNQALAELDQTDFKIKLSSRQAEFEKANSDFNRGKEIVKAGHISRADYDKLRAQFKSAQANLKAAKQNLEYTVLRAAFSGVIAKRYVDNFEEISAKQPVYLIHDISSLIVKVNVPESIMIKVKKNMNSKVFAVFDTISDKQFPLTVYEVSTQADENTNTYQISFSMAVVEEFNILPGMSLIVRGERILSETKQSFTVPAGAVLQDRQGTFVYVVEHKINQVGIIVRKNVTTGSLNNSGLEIVTGLKAGDSVVTAGMSKMVPGLRVRLTP